MSDPLSPSHAAGRIATVARLRTLGAVAVVRLPDAGAAVRVAEALHAGGVSAVELTMTTPGALAAIAAVARELPDVVVGVGSVLDADTARQAIDAGAVYVVSPAFVADVVETAHRAGVAAMPGAFTPTEILAAHRAGADVVKVFPADPLGPAFIKGVLAPMPFLKLMPTGGVTPENAGSWLRAGAVAVGVGGALVDAAAVAAGDFARLTASARRLAESVAAVRREAMEVTP